MNNTEEIQNDCNVNVSTEVMFTKLLLIAPYYTTFYTSMTLIHARKI